MADAMAVMSEEKTTAPTTISEVQRKMKLTGTVKRTELYGAFLDLGVGADAVLHISQVENAEGRRVSDIFKVGDLVTVWVDKIDLERGQILVTTIRPLAVEWQDLDVGKAYTGQVVRLENFGAFVDIGAEKEGLVHISELSHEYVKHPSQAVSVGDEVNVEVLSFSKRKRRINLSMKSLLPKPELPKPQELIAEVIHYDEPEVEDDDDQDVPTAMEFALRRAMGKDAPKTGVKKDRIEENKKLRRQDARRTRRRERSEDILARTLDLD